MGGTVHLSGVRAFVAVARCGSTTEAAAELGFTQSAVSRQVADFERFVGTKLFGRRQGGMRLNSAGTEVFPAAVEILRLAESMTGMAASNAALAHSLPSHRKC
ncbi:LysR family transcriptional regulator [Sinomonas sp. ASV322]|uniref:LysR family transcriptional regulator n=1 Tax=Sinomonas sp. ASV322 TaxID=3041920 RepID=UPI0027DB1C9B|nr:LysR family transcriptional regulator [Sinomonas sp. ASV322]MDQ4501789.1 LysR family transcriptional regulator [Sinomonas sp. ASV322]